MTEGWIALHRKIYNSKDFNNQLEVAVFLYLVSMASHKNCEVIYRKKRIKLKRGEVSISYKDLSNKFDVSERKIRTIIRNLITTGNVNQTLTRNLSVYSIVKYSKYQDVPSKTNQNMTDRTTTNIYNTISNKNSMNKSKEIAIPVLQSLNKKIEVKKELNEWELLRQKLDPDDYQKYVLHRLNSCN